ncbi:MAG TPA: DUF6152 family protein [Terriglobia bacterium]|nr:DUF6152 family protein [Terriglobia bacterium]
MKARSTVLVAGFAILLATIPALAHHAFNAEFDRNKPITLTGKVNRVEWMNPHARIYVDVKSEKGDVITWDFELGSPNGLMRNGWRRDSLKKGDEVTVTGWLAKNAPNVGNAGSVVMVTTGRRMFAASSEGDSNPNNNQ